MPPRRNSTSPSADASRSGRPCTSRARRMIGSWRAASPRGGACRTSARRSSSAADGRARRGRRRSAPARAPSPPMRRRRDAAGATAHALACAHDRAATTAASGACRAARCRWIVNLGERLGAQESAGEAPAGREAGFARAPPDGTKRARGRAAPICRIDYPRGVRCSTSRALPSLRDLTSFTRPAIAWADSARAAAFFAWLRRVGPRARPGRSLAAAGVERRAAFAATSASIAATAASAIVMDAPPPQEDVRPFVHVAGLIAAAGLHAPRVLEADAPRGFLLLDDLGSELYLRRAARRAAQRRHAARRRA